MQSPRQNTRQSPESVSPSSWASAHFGLEKVFDAKWSSLSLAQVPMTLPNLSTSASRAAVSAAHSVTKAAAAFPRRDIVDALERLLDLGEVDAIVDDGGGDDKADVCMGEDGSVAAPAAAAAARAAAAAKAAALSAASAEVASLQQRLERSTVHGEQLRERVERGLDDQQRRALGKVCAARMSSIDAALEKFKEDQRAVLTHGGEARQLAAPAGAARTQAAALMPAPGSGGVLSHRIGSRAQRCLSLEKAVISAEARAALQATVLQSGSLCAVHRPKRALLPAAAKDMLNRWFVAHADSPFPSDADKLALAAEGGITKEQVSVWFTNVRARAKTRERKALEQDSAAPPPPPTRPPPASPVSSQEMAENRGAPLPVRVAHC